MKNMQAFEYCRMRKFFILSCAACFLLASLLFYECWGQSPQGAMPISALLKDQEFYLYNITALMLILVPLFQMTENFRIAKYLVICYAFTLLFLAIGIRSIHSDMILLVLFFAIQMLILFSPLIKRLEIDKIKYTAKDMLLIAFAAVAVLLACIF